MPGANIGVMNINDMLSKAMGGQRTKTRKTTVKESYAHLIDDESDKLLDQDQVVQMALQSAQNDGIVFLDEIDKIAARDGGMGAGVSREGVQRDLLPLVEGTTVATKYGPIKTDHILFIASGAFHVSKPSDLLPELQGRLPIRVELRALEKDDFRRILTEPQASLIKQYVALMNTEGVTLSFTDDAIDSLAGIAVDLNATLENIGARRLQTVMERVLDDISYNAPDRAGTEIDDRRRLCRRSMSATCPRTQICRDSSFKGRRRRVGAGDKTPGNRDSTPLRALPRLRGSGHAGLRRHMTRSFSLAVALFLALGVGAAQAQMLVPVGNRHPEQPGVPGASAKRTQAGKTSFEAKYRKVYDAVEARRRTALQDQGGGRRLRHRPDAHCRRDRRRAHLQCRRL